MTNKLPPLPVAASFDDEYGSFTDDQMQAYGQQCRDAALEEAAKACDERSNGENDAQWCADRIRSLT